MKIFDSILIKAPRKNKFDLSHEVKMTCNMGPLYPILCTEVVPGDQFRVSSEVFLRFLALLAPVMHRVNVWVHFFHVPNRLIWQSWEDFITGGRDGLAAPSFPVWNPATLNALSPNYLKAGSLLDHLGFPVMKAAGTYQSGYNVLNFSALPLRAYQLIYDAYYRDQNVTPSVLSATFKSDGVVAGADLTTLVTLRNRAWEKDYLTSALPWTQRGAGVTVPATNVVNYNIPSKMRNTSGNAQTGATSITTDGSGNIQTAGGTNAGTGYLDNIASIATSITINALRLSEKLQVWLERNAQAGGRYREQILGHFGVMSSDARLQRPEYLGGGMQPVVISEVLQQAPVVSGSTPLATLAGHGVSVGTSNQFSRFFEEHGWVIGLMSILPKTAYQQQCPLKFTRVVNTNYLFPEFARLGEQAVGNAEAYLDLGDAAGAPGIGSTFGYQSRYAEYKYEMSSVRGQFRESLAYWHMGRVFASAPALNTSFIEAVPRTDAFAVQSDVDHIVVQIYHRIDALRPLPYYGTPSISE